MASEIISVPEEHLEDTVKVITLGLEAATDLNIHIDAVSGLSNWCNSMNEYLQQQKDDER